MLSSRKAQAALLTHIERQQAARCETVAQARSTLSPAPLPPLLPPPAPLSAQEAGMPYCGDDMDGDLARMMDHQDRRNRSAKHMSSHQDEKEAVSDELARVSAAIDAIHRRLLAQDGHLFGEPPQSPPPPQDQPSRPRDAANMSDVGSSGQGGFQRRRGEDETAAQECVLADQSDGGTCDNVPVSFWWEE
jgi:hypothetical protein